MDKNFKKVFNLNTIMTVLLNYAAYIVLIGSAAILIYLSFIKKLNVHIDVVTFTVFAGAVILLSFITWNTFYKRRYEKVMADDIEQYAKNKYSIHVRYYNAIKGWTNNELQNAIDEYNKEYVASWLNYVESDTGVPIETTYVQEVDERTNQPKFDENNKPILTKVLGIKDRPYRGFFHKILMWRIKHHKYPKSGYKSAITVSSLFSYNDSELNKRNLHASKTHLCVSGAFRLFSTILVVCVGAALTPDILEENFIAVVMKLIVGLWILISGAIGGTISGAKGAKIKLSVVEDVCKDLEQWADKKPIIEKYEITKNEISTKQNSENDSLADTYENIFTIANEK